MTKEEKLKVEKELADILGVDKDDVCVAEFNPFAFFEHLMDDIIAYEKCEEDKKANNKKVDDTNPESFSDIFYRQAENQRDMLKKGMYFGFSNMSKEQMYDVELPIDDTKICSYHIQQLVSEIGELLDADKRWKNFRNNKNNQKNKLEELADCFIELINITMFSGYTYLDIMKALRHKVEEVHNRITAEK